MTDCNCGCSTFGPGPHDPDLRHPNPKACEHSEDGLDDSDAEVERWYLAFEKVSGYESRTLAGKRDIYEAFAAEYARLGDAE